jgi:putative epimerase/dehydratase
MKILITGVRGFVGKNLVPALSAHHTVYGLGRTVETVAGIERMYTWEDLDRGAAPEVDAIIHLAGKAHDTKKQTGAEVYFVVNRDLTIKVYDYFLHSASRKFIFFSSVKAVADFVNGTVLTEDAVPKPVGAYGESKIEAETYILGHPCEGKDVYILRPCMMHGPGNKGNLNLLYKVVRKGIPWPLGAFENRRSFASIGNVCYVVCRLLEEQIPSGVYNLADDEPVSTNELISIICEVLGKQACILNIPPLLMKSAARIGDLLHLPLNTERIEKLTENYVVSNTRIKSALGIEVMPTAVKVGLRGTIESFNK